MNHYGKVGLLAMTIFEFERNVSLKYKLLFYLMNVLPKPS